MKGDANGQGVVPLRTILRNILNLIDSFEARYKEGLDSYDQEFQELKQFSENLKSDPDYVCKEGEKGVNRKKNRYKDILPFDYTRVILGDYGDIPGSDYINANFIKGASGSSAYIACQGPLPHTVNDFWRMVVECEVQVIVMACNEQESGKHKCENYWVEEEGVEREFGQVTVWLKKSRQVCPDFLVRTMKIRYPNTKGEPEERSVCQFHYSAWPDHGVPLKVRPLLDMVRLIRDCQTSETLPVLVHCSAGCGRTGTICAIDYVWGLLRLGKLSQDFSLFNLVREMRRQRIAMVQTKDQYILVHRAVRELFEEQLKIIDSHPYANVDINGLPLEAKSGAVEEPVYETVHFVTKSVEDDEESVRRKCLMTKSLPPPIPVSPPEPTSFIAATKHEKDAENYQRHLEQEKLKVTSSECGSGTSGNITSVVMCSPSSSTDCQVDVPPTSENKDILPQQEQEDKIPTKRGSFGGKNATSSKSSLLRNPSIVKLKAFFEKSKEDKEKKAIPTLSRAKSDVSSSSRFYANFASSFTSRGSRNSQSRSKNLLGSISKPSSPKEKLGDKSPSEKIKSKPSILSKPNMSVKRSKSLKIIRPADDELGDNMHLINHNVRGDMVDGMKLVRSSISSSTSHSTSSSQTHLESWKAIKVCVKQMDMPILQKPVAKSVKAESFKATTSQASQEPEPRRNSVGSRQDTYNRNNVQDNDSRQPLTPTKKPDVPSKSHLYDKVSAVTKGIYGTTRVKVRTTNDVKEPEMSSNTSKINGKIKKYGTVNSKTFNAATGGGGTLLTRSQSHVWQPSKPNQMPVRIFSDENLSQVGTGNGFEKIKGTENRSFCGNNSVDEADGLMLIRKQSLPISKAVASKIPPASGTTYISPENINKDKEQPRSLTLTSHSSFLEARKRVPKTNPYANYTPSEGIYNNKSQSPVVIKMNQEKEGSPKAQFHFGDQVPMLKSIGNNNIGNSSESSSNPGTPRNSLPGTPTQSTDVLYSPLSVNTVGVNYASTRGQSKSILKGSLSSTPSESDERLDSYRPHVSSIQSPVQANITGPQKVSSVRIAVGVRERRNSFRQAVWKEEQAPTATSIPVQNDKSENIYITTTSSVPYFVKSTSMPMHPNIQTYEHGTTPAVTARQNRDYEPIWPDPANSSNPFKIGSSTSTVLVNVDSHVPVPVNKLTSNSNVFQAPQTKLETQVHDRMAEIKVLLEELRAPGKREESKQRSSSRDHVAGHLPTRKSHDKLSQTNSAEKSHPSGSSTNLKHHRSLRAPSRPQYPQGLSCFTFKKPCSFESITDQLHAEEFQLTKSNTHTKDDPRYSPYVTESPKVNTDGSFINKSFQHAEQQSTGNHRLNDYVSLRSCRSSSTTRNTQPVDNVHDSPPKSSYPMTSGSDHMPIPPPRSKRAGTLRKDQGNYVNVSPTTTFQAPRNAWRVGPDTNGINDNHLSNGITLTSATINKPESCTVVEQVDNHQSNGRQLPRITSASSIPLANGNANPSSPKAIIRALGLFQAKAANVRSRFANWTDNKDRLGSKRANSTPIVPHRRDRSIDRDGLHEGPSPSSRLAPSSIPSTLPSTSKHQYL